MFAFTGILWACYPLLTIPVYSGDAKIWVHNTSETSGQDRPRWADFRETGLDMDHECLRTDGLAPRYRSTLSSILPDYGCLILSPANIWRKDSSLFQSDDNIVDTVFQLQRSRKGHSSLADIMLGLRQRDTGMTKYPVNNRQRTITYSVMVVISVVIYQTGMVENIIKLNQAGLSDSRSGEKMDLSGLSSSSKGSLMSAINSKISAENISSIFSAHQASDGIKSLSKLQHKDTDDWRRLPYSHWPMLFGLYNSEDELDSLDIMEEIDGKQPLQDEDNL